MFELGIQKNWIDALCARSSVRQYTGAPDKEQLDRLGETCRKLSWQGVKIRMFKGPGLKSQIKGTDVYAVIVAKRGTPMEVEGYMGEALVLEATSMGLGTCWLGAGFYPDIINRNVDLQTDEAVHCVISIGKANLPAFAPKRKELVKVCGMDEAQLGQLGAWQKEAVLAARLAELRKPKDLNSEALDVARTPNQRKPVIDAIRVENNSKVSDEVIRHYIRQPLGTRLDLGRLQDDMSTLYGLDYFDQVQYRVVKEKKLNTLVIHATGKKGGTDFLRLGLNLSDDMRGESTFNLGGSYRMNGLNRLGAEWLTRVQLGDRQELYSEFYQPLDVGSRYFVAPFLFHEAQNVDVTEDNDPLLRYRLERYGYGLNVGRQIANNGEIRLGAVQAYGKADVRIGDPSLPDIDFTEGYYELKYSFDTVDDVNFPHEGEEIGLTMRRYDKSLGSDDSYRQWDLRLNKALSFGADTWVFGGGYGRTLDDAEVVTSSFTLGGARELSGFRRDALSGQNYSLGRIVYYRRLTERSFLPLDFPLYLGGSIERGRIWNNDNEYDSGYINAASLMIGFDTPLGPLTFSYGINDENFKAFYLNLGQNF